MPIRDRIRQLTEGRLRVGTDAYQRHTKEEIDHYRKLYEKADADRERLIERVPGVWEEVHRRADERIRALTGNDMRSHVLERLQSRPGVRMLSLGSGPGGVELMFAREAPEAEIVCMDLNPDLLKLGRASAQGEGLPVRFEQADLNTVKLPPREYDLLFCHASLHHVLELEWLFEQMRGALRPGGEVIAVDVISRSGYRMWPETREVVRKIWATLPDRYRINHTGYREKRVDKEIWDLDTRTKGMECIRSEDIVPLLEKTFRRRAFAGYLSLCRRFFDTMYGPNFDLSRPMDLAFLDWVWQLDCYNIDTEVLRPESFFGIYSLRA